MIAQQCKKCHEVIVVEVRAKECPFCDESFPKKKKKPVQTEHKVFTAVTEKASSDIIGEFVALQNDILQLYNNAYGFLSKNNNKIKSKEMSNEELCDFGYICRELAKVFDELRKEMNARMDLCGSIIAFRKTKASLTDPTLQLKVVGQFATASPDVKIEVGLPKKHSPEYYQVTDALGVPREVAEKGILKLDWKSVTKYCTEQVNAGKKIPKGFGQQYPKYRVTYRKRKVN